MDYKELIRRLVECDQCDETIRNDELSLAIEDAADALETLLAERDAAVECIRGNCGECVNFKVPVDSMPCRDCYNGAADHWQWRGP